VTLEALAKQVEKQSKLLEQLVAQLGHKPDDVVLTRAEAARQLKISVRQLQRLVAAGRIVPLPSGIARAELERYAKTPQTPLPKVVTKPMRERTASDEAARLDALLKTRRARR
jgi:hypothetical protein